MLLPWLYPASVACTGTPGIYPNSIRHDNINYCDPSAYKHRHFHNIYAADHHNNPLNHHHLDAFADLYTFHTANPYRYSYTDRYPYPVRYTHTYGYTDTCAAPYAHIHTHTAANSYTDANPYINRYRDFRGSDFYSYFCSNSMIYREVF